MKAPRLEEGPRGPRDSLRLQLRCIDLRKNRLFGFIQDPFYPLSVG